MGLDIYLRRVKNLEAMREYEARQSAAHEAIYNEHDDEAGPLCDKWDQDNPAPTDGLTERFDDLKSKVYPDHYSGIGYLRSSYNSGGINSVLRDQLGGNTDLYYIFGVDGEESNVRPDWGASLARAIEIRDRFAAHLKASGSFYVHKAAPSMFAVSSIASEKQALDIFLDHHRRYLEDKRIDKFESYSNREGFFALAKPLEVVALIDGVEESIIAKVQGKQAFVPVTYAVCKRTDEPGERPFESYQQTLEIVVEMIEFVLSHGKDAQEFYLRWSG